MILKDRDVTTFAFSLSEEIIMEGSVQTAGTGRGHRGARCSLRVNNSIQVAIREGILQAERGEFVPDNVIAQADKHHGI
jgi:hypothetical protein